VSLNYEQSVRALITSCTGDAAVARSATARSLRHGHPETRNPDPESRKGVGCRTPGRLAPPPRLGRGFGFGVGCFGLQASVVGFGVGHAPVARLATACSLRDGHPGSEAGSYLGRVDFCITQL